MKKKTLLTILLLAGILTGCRTTKHTVTDERVETSVQTEQVTVADSTEEVTEAARVTKERTTTLSDESGTVAIERDSMGRPVLVRWRVLRESENHKLATDSTSKVIRAMHIADSLRNELARRESREKIQERKETSASRGVNAVCWFVWGFLLLFGVYALLEGRMPSWIKKIRERWRK